MAVSSTLVSRALILVSPFLIVARPLTVPVTKLRSSWKKLAPWLPVPRCSVALGELIEPSSPRMMILACAVRLSARS